jgi:hypothetical protein
MLSIGVNLKKVDYNRKDVIVHHVTDDITGKPLPICGAKVDNLLSGIDAEYVLENLGRADFDYFRDETDLICERCKKIYLSPESEEGKSKKRLRRWEEKENRKRLVNQYKDELTKYSEKCPKCEKVTRSAKPLGFSFASTTCDSCGVKWTFFGSAKHTGQFEIWVRDETRVHDGKLSGHIHDSETRWEWR